MPVFEESVKRAQMGRLEAYTYESVKEDLECQEAHKTWRINTPLYYDTVTCHTLDSNSLTVQWMPDVRRPHNEDYTLHRALIGNRTRSHGQDQLMVLGIKVPRDKTHIDPLVGRISSRITIEKQINHLGEVIRARYMPSNPNIIATKSPTGSVYIFDLTKHPDKPANPNEQCKPELSLRGHKQEGHALDWHPRYGGFLLSGSEDGTICLWDIEYNPRNNGGVEPLSTFNHTVKAVAWNNLNWELFASVGKDRKLCIWDRRINDGPAIQVIAHTDEADCVDFHPRNDFLIATGGADAAVRVWDPRLSSMPLYGFETPKRGIWQVHWSPHMDKVIGACGSDRCVYIWDLAMNGVEQTYEELLRGPPNLRFNHTGHTSDVSDFSWNLNEEWLISSVSIRDKMIQVWKITNDSSDEDQEDVPDEELENF